jgi:hypothetical protein
MGDHPVLAGLVLYLLIAVTPTMMFWLALRVLPAALTALRDRRRPVVPPGPPLEDLVADLRRLRRDMCGPPQRTQVRRVALAAAYDDALLDVCRAVGVAVPPLDAAAGSERAFARLQAEAALEAAGIALDPRPGKGSAAA